jgi:excisionase family DNA binding protein
MITAEHVYKEIVEMPVQEREKLFAAIARRGFEKNSYSHEEILDDIRQTPLTVKETAEYLEVAEITIRRWARSGKLQAKRVGKNLVFEPNELKALKKQYRQKDKRKKKELAYFCGKWQDERDADDIVAEIYADRLNNTRSERITI